MAPMDSTDEIRQDEPEQSVNDAKLEAAEHLRIIIHSWVNAVPVQLIQELEKFLDTHFK